MQVRRSANYDNVTGAAQGNAIVRDSLDTVAFGNCPQQFRIGVTGLNPGSTGFLKAAQMTLAYATAANNGDVMHVMQRALVSRESSETSMSAIRLNLRLMYTVVSFRL